MIEWHTDNPQHSAFHACKLGANDANLTSEMKVFVSGQIQEKERIQKALARLEEAGLTVTHDWTRTEDLIDRVTQAEEAGRRAALDIQGVLAADVYILISDNKEPGKGMYAELGAALALKELRGSPEVFVVGPQHHQSIFYLHPSVRSVAELEEVLWELQPSDSDSGRETLDEHPAQAG